MKKRNTSRNRTVIFLALLCAALAATAMAADWPHLQGPNRDGVSAETGLARAWPEGGPKVLWTKPLGEGFGGAAIEKGKVYVLDRVSGEEKNDEKDVLRCMDLISGKELWTFSYDAPGKTGYNGSRSVPTVDEKYIYIVGALGDFHCVDKETHKAVWRKYQLKDIDDRLIMWGIAQEPLVYKDLVIVAGQGFKESVLAFDKTTGHPVWKSPPLKGALRYTSPIAMNLCGHDQIVMVTAKVRPKNIKDKTAITPNGQVVGLSPQDGSILWSYDNWQCINPIPYPTRIGNDGVFITAEYDAGSALIRIQRMRDSFQAVEQFKTMDCGSCIHQPLLYKNHLYVNSNGGSRRDGLLCMTLDGTVKWQTGNSLNLSNFKEKLPNFQRGNILLADGMIFALDGKKGDLRLIEANPMEYKELARAQMFESKSGNNIWAPMALSDGKLVLRDQNEMKCLDVRNP